MNKTKQKILNASKDLFNEQGYSHVTIRMIALKLGMSSGNLNYHFKKREEILEALYFEMVSDFDQRLENLSEIEISFAQISNDIQLSMERMLNYKFIWTDLHNILKANEKIYVHFYEVYKHRIAGNVYLFDQLNEMGIMRPASFEKEYKMLAERMVNFGDTWINTSEVYLKESNTKYVESQVHAMMAIFYPYLTKKGEEGFKKVVPEWFT
ncbi:MAG: AcrR family transcriptional regulator [Crocinitomicaceae bacterium]|jgi:AcrR family transcriptional regulator